MAAWSYSLVSFLLCQPRCQPVEEALREANFVAALRNLAYIGMPWLRSTKDSPAYISMIGAFPKIVLFSN